MASGVRNHRQMLELLAAELKVHDMDRKMNEIAKLLHSLAEP